MEINNSQLVIICVNPEACFQSQRKILAAVLGDQNRADEYGDFTP